MVSRLSFFFINKGSLCSDCSYYKFLENVLRQRGDVLFSVYSTKTRKIVLKTIKNVDDSDIRMEL